MIFKYCAACGHELEDIKCGNDDCKICPFCKKYMEVVHSLLLKF